MKGHMDIQNGDKVQDKVTGIVTGVADYMTGCRQCCVSAPAKDGKTGETAWFDDDRLTVVTTGAVSLSARKRDGGPQSNPAPAR